MADIRIDVVHAGTPGQGDRTILPGAVCPLCDHKPEPGQAVIRIEDYNAGPGIRQHVLCKRCVQLLLDATMDDLETERSVFDHYREALVRQYENIEN